MVSIAEQRLTCNRIFRHLTYYSKKKPKLIFLDLIMPVVNGYELCHQIRRVEALKEIPVVILTGNMVDRVRARMSGASECITKPVEVDKIRAVLSRYQAKA